MDRREFFGVVGTVATPGVAGCVQGIAGTDDAAGTVGTPTVVSLDAALSNALELDAGADRAAFEDVLPESILARTVLTAAYDR